jgi:AcrR family transcriptional regulator
MSEARRRVLKAAISCFGSKGYAATTIADIELAAGLTPGAGGTYRHFRSKRAILDAVIEATVSASNDELAPPQTDLEQTAHNSLAYMGDDMMRIFFTDLAEFPEHRERIIQRLVTGPYRIVGERISKHNPTADGPAFAAVLLGSLINFRVIEVLYGKGGNGISQKRFVDAWGQLYRLGLGTSPKPHAKKAATAKSAKR